MIVVDFVGFLFDVFIGVVIINNNPLFLKNKIINYVTNSKNKC